MTTDAAWPGKQLGLPEAGPGALARMGRRVVALLADWGACMIVAMGLFGPGVLHEGGWKAWMTMAVFYVESTLLTALVGGSFGQLITRIGVRRLDGGAVGVRAALRQGLVCLVIPALVSGADGRGLHDVVCGTVLVNRK